MKITKKIIDNLNRCYCASVLNIEGNKHLIFSEEAKGGRCFEYYGENFENKRLIWDNGGGTMSIIPLNETEFLAIQSFFPGFDAKDSKIVWASLENDNWIVNDYIDVPYLHRFDIINVGNKKYLIGGVLCENKESREDWSSPGKIVYGELTNNYTQKPILKEFPVKITKNHGYCKVNFKGKESCFFAGQDGVFRVFEQDGKLEVEKILNKPVSDMTLIDIDNDGLEEMMTIEPFHGDKVNIYHQFEDGWKKVYTYDKTINFAHGICCGKILGKNSFVLGIRKENKELVVIQYDNENKCYNEIEIDKEVGTANVFLIEEDKKDILVACNHTIDEAAIYILED